MKNGAIRHTLVRWATSVRPLSHELVTAIPPAGGILDKGGFTTASNQLTRRDLLLGVLPAPLLQRRTAARSKILIILIDGFGPDYLDKSDMPHLKRMCREGAFKIGRSVMPSVTNVNNASLITGCFPEEHGITSNFWYDPASGRFAEMESAEYVRKPTIFELSKKRGLRSALITTKDKVRTLCSRGADIELSAEAPTPEYVQRIGKKENMYSAEVNYWTLRAARHVLKSVDLMYLSTTDYMMHTYAPDSAQSIEHLHQVDRLLGEIVDDHPSLQLYLTADHGMNAKPQGLDLTRILAAQSVKAIVTPIIRDKHTTHHQNLGGSVYIYLDRPSELPKAVDILKNTAGVEDVFDRQAAARVFRLEPGRIGDLLALATKETAFGDLDQTREPTKVRSHGSRHEAQAPLVVYGRKVDMAQYEYNLDLTRNLLRDWA